MGAALQQSLRECLHWLKVLIDFYFLIKSFIDRQGERYDENDPIVQSLVELEVSFYSIDYCSSIVIDTVTFPCRTAVKLATMTF